MDHQLQEHACNDVEIAPSFSFKPIDLDISTSSSGEGNFEPVSPDTIFRCFGEGLEQLQQGLMLSVRRANPINEQQSGAQIDENEDMTDDAARVISPYPLSHNEGCWEGQDDALTTSLGWKLHSLSETLADHSTTTVTAVDYSRFFIAHDDDDMMDDDFSVSSQEANSLSNELLETISEDPAGFWEEGLSHQPQQVPLDMQTRCPSPSEVSWENGEQGA